MLIFGCCVGKSGKYERIAEPALRLEMAPSDRLILEDGRDGICAAYNRILRRARITPDCEGVVLLHDDTELRHGSRDLLADNLAQANVGVVGVVGGAGLYGPMWNESRRQAGFLSQTLGNRGAYRGANPHVDVVDGLLLAISPLAFKSILFDEANFPAFHGYDTDYCLTVRAAGLDVMANDKIDYHHHCKTDLGDSQAFDRSAEALGRKWSSWIRPLAPWERVALKARGSMGLVQHHGMTLLKNAFEGRNPQ